MTPDEFWKSEYGKALEAKDFAGRLVRKGHFSGNFPSGNKLPSTAWDCDHIEPLNPAGSEKHKQRLGGIENWQVANVVTNKIKGNKTSFEIDGTLYQVQRNIPAKIQGKRLAPYPNKASSYKGKKYCIVILEENK